MALRALYFMHMCHNEKAPSFGRYKNNWLEAQIEHIPPLVTNTKAPFVASYNADFLQLLQNVLNDFANCPSTSTLIFSILQKTLSFHFISHAIHSFQNKQGWG